ncbi:MAG: 23S rRNA (adenine(2503)-C(2))-methyltransferase RlmN [Vicinamibacterales bacterium]|nr:23S rRNA (adenine(2503)-C(2))-methyltransferase RlmN [Vicinamibacterales bacterium]MDP6609502.1 23S rRNA (adenine(2503)-C(2))-methyltransferase RlmN [Vicinamibacterales bacterium]
MAAATRDLAELELPELQAALTPSGIEPYRAKQVFRWIHRRAVLDWTQMTDLAKQHRAALAEAFHISTPGLAARYESSDSTQKFLLRLADGRHIEAVYIPNSPADTFCVSTQVGCAMQCSFCLTAKMGLERNLTAGEIVGQVRLLRSELRLLDRPINIVLMGMGEPLHNYDATVRALRILTCPDGAAISPRRITLSTVGIVPALARLAHEPVMPNLAISLHGTTDEQRTPLVPVNRRYPLAEVLRACRAFPLNRRNRITFEYVLIRDVNDSVADARRLAGLLKGLRAKVNVIPLNAAPGIPHERPSAAQIDRFGKALADCHVTVSIRKSRGRDIRAACGQLLVESGQPSPGQRLASLIDTPAIPETTD